MILSNLMPYLGICVKIAKRRCCCCCKRKNYKPNTHLNPEFPIERRYASLIATSFICFSYGLAMPVMFITFTALIGTQIVMDKLLITYFYKERVERNDLMNRKFLSILKYALFAYMFIGGLALASNYATISNEIVLPLDYSNMHYLFFKIWAAPEILLYNSVCLLAFFITLDLIVTQS